MPYPKKILHWIDDRKVESASGKFFSKINPATGKPLAQVTRGNAKDVTMAIVAAQKGFEIWSETTIIKRADLLRDAVLLMRERTDEIIDLVVMESGKPRPSGVGEVAAAIECGFFYAGEGRRYFGTTLTSSAPNRSVWMIRQPIGIGALLTPFNNPAAGIAWKIFPALLAGNAVILKSHEYTPAVALWYAQLLKEVGLPAGVFSVLQGFGAEVGAPLIENAKVRFMSLTGGVKTGQAMLRAGADRFAKVSIESGGKNALVVAGDADLEKAAQVVALAGFVDAGQRCSAASRVVVFDSVYDEFREKLRMKVADMSVGPDEKDDFGAIISEDRMKAILSTVERAKKAGASLLAGGKQLKRNGFFIEPTILEDVSKDAEVSTTELFGPVVILYRVQNFAEAVEIVNSTDFKLSASIHTRDIHRAQEFINRVNTGVVRVNGPTHGSEAHMPFGGPGMSGNGWREPGTQALDFYSEWKQISIDHDPEKV